MRLAAGLKVSAMIRAVQAAGGFAAVVARGDPVAGSIAIVVREPVGEILLVPVMTGDGRYQHVEAARGDAVAEWSARARQHDPDLWILELDIPDAARFIVDILGRD
jgi:hypothetical protein